MEKCSKNSTSFGFRPFPFSFLSDFLSPWFDVKSLLRPSNFQLQNTNDVQVYTMRNDEFQESPTDPVYCVNMCLKKKSHSSNICPTRNKTGDGQLDCICDCWHKCSEQTKRLEAEIERLERMVNGIQSIQGDNGKIKDKNKKVQTNISSSTKHATNKTTEMEVPPKLKTIASYEGTFGPDSGRSDAETERPVARQRESQRPRKENDSPKKEDKKKVICPWYKNTQDLTPDARSKSGGGETINKKNLTCRCGNDKQKVQFEGGEIITGKGPTEGSCGSQGPCYHNYICLSGNRSKDSKLLAHIAKELERQKHEIEKLKEILSGTKPKVVEKGNTESTIRDKLPKTAKTDGRSSDNNQQETKSVDAATLKKEYRETGVSKTLDAHEPNLIAEKTAGT